MNIYISNLNFKVEDDNLRQLFEDYGEVSSAKVITDKYTGKSRGFGFVEMPDQDASLKAISELNQCEHEGKVLTVNEARPKEDRPRNNFSRGGGGGGGYRSNGGSGGGYGHGGGDRDRQSKRW